MNVNTKIYATRREAIQHEIVPLITGWELDFDIEHLEDNMLTQHYDNGRFIGISVAQLTDEEFHAILEEAMEIAGL